MSVRCSEGMERMKPAWKDAPEWANWLAMDLGGRWWFYECIPVKEIDCWSPHGGKMEDASYKDWAETLEGRPE